MKKSFESGKIWTILSACIFVMMCGLVVFAGQYVTKISSDEHFKDWRTEFLGQNKDGNPILTGGDWNAIMDSLNGLIIPHGAIMAFTGDCPLGWSKYTAANDRFLMGAEYGIGTTGGAARISLEWNQLPRHSHYFEETAIFEDASQYGLNDGSMHSRVLTNGYFRLDTKPGTNRWKGNKDIDDTTSFITVLRRTGIDIDYYNGIQDGPIEWDDYENSRSYEQKEIDIRNPYIRVRYCIKD